MASRRTVLVVDPNPNTRERVAAAIGTNDFEVIESKDAQDAEAAAADKNLVLVLACASLPRGNGYDLASRMRVTHPKAVVFLLSGGFEAYDSGRAQAAGVVGRIPKPFSPDTLLFHINAAVGALTNLGQDELALVDATALEPEPEPEEKPADRRAKKKKAKADPPLEELEPVAELPVFDGALLPISEDTEPPGPIVRERKKGARRPLGVPDTHYRPPATSERVATFLPRDYEELPRVSVDPAIVGPAIEQAILEVLPEVVEIVLRRALATSDAVKEILTAAVEEAVKRELPAAVDRAQRKT